MRSPACGHLRESTHAAANIQHQFSSQILGTKSSALAKCILGAVAGGIIQLRARVKLPLKSETVRIIVLICEADDAVHRGISRAAGCAHQPVNLLSQSASACQAAQDGENLVSESRPPPLHVLHPQVSCCCRSQYRPAEYSSPPLEHLQFDTSRRHSPP